MCYRFRVCDFVSRSKTVNPTQILAEATDGVKAAETKEPVGDSAQLEGMTLATSVSAWIKSRRRECAHDDNHSDHDPETTKHWACRRSRIQFRAQREFDEAIGVCVRLCSRIARSELTIAQALTPLVFAPRANSIGIHACVRSEMQDDRDCGAEKRSGADMAVCGS